MCYHTITERLSKTDLDKSNTRTRYCQWEKDCLSGDCTSTTEYPSPEMIHAGEVTPGRRGKAVERTKAAKTPCRSNKAAGQERVRCVAEDR